MLGLAQVTGLMAGGLNVGRLFIKDEKVLLMFLMGLHLFCGVTFILLEIFPGAFVCFLLGILYMINYIYAYKEKEISILVLIAYAIVCTVLGMFTTNTYALNILPTVFAILTIIGIYFEKNKKVYRILEIAQSTIWTIYTLCTGAFMIAISSATVVGLVLRDVYRYDINKEVEPTTGLEIDLAAEEAERNMENEEKYQMSKKKLENGNDTGDVLLTSKLLNNYKNASVSPGLRGLKIFGKRGHHKKNNSYQSRYKRL